MELSFSRGFSPGWLEGNDHKRLVPGLDSSKRGIQLGEIVELRSQEICIRPETTVALGDGLAIHSKGASSQPDEQGGRVYSLRTDQKRSLQEFGNGLRPMSTPTRIHRGRPSVYGLALVVES